MNRGMSSFHAAGVLGVACMAMAAGCTESTPTERRWTTKDDSVLNLSAHPEFGPAEAMEVIDAGDLRESSLHILLQAAESTNPLLRANAIEALHAAPAHLEKVLRPALGDQNKAVRFVAAMTVGKFKLIDLARLLQPLLVDESQSVQAAAMYGLKRCGREVDLNPLAGMLTGDDPEAKGNAALVLGELEDPSAIALLKHSAGRGLARTPLVRRKVVELQLAEAMVKLGAMEELEVIHAALFAPIEQGELIALACQMCGELKDSSAVSNMLVLATRSGERQEPGEIRMAATQAIAQVDPDRAPAGVPLEYTHSGRFELRAQAAHTLGAINRESCLPHLANLLHDPNPLVQVAAAEAVLRLR